jgi:uncharacterized protein YoxC
MSKNRNTILIIVIGIALAVLVYFLLRDPKQLDSHKSEYDKVVADNKALHHRQDSILRRADSLETAGRSKDSANTALKAEKKATEKEADKYAATSARLANEVKELRRGDTSEFAHKCDSLAEQVKNFAFLYEQYKGYSDSLTAKMDSQGEDYVMALEERRKLYDELKRQHDQLLEAYKALFADYAKAQKSVRRERLKTKIAALLALVGGAAAVLK